MAEFLNEFPTFQQFQPLHESLRHPANNHKRVSARDSSQH